MDDQSASAKRWNLFARELEDILATYNIRLGHLDDRAGIHREKVRRLIQSLSTPKSFPVLNTEEMEQVIQTFQLSDEEVLRLRAALLATSIEKTLMDRINQDDALLAAEQAFPTILKALREQVSVTSGLGATKIGDGGAGANYAGNLLDSIWVAIDDAEIALHLSYDVHTHKRRVEKARYARTRYEEAQAELEEVQDRMSGLQVWQHYYDRTQVGLTAANERLEDLGE
jgi:hypothetical protein